MKLNLFLCPTNHHHRRQEFEETIKNSFVFISIQNPRNQDKTSDEIKTAQVGECRMRHAVL
jgi:hypothetical protein